MNKKISIILDILIILFTFIILLLIVIAGVNLIKNNDTNGYFVICIGLQFFILKSNRINERKRRQENNE